MAYLAALGLVGFTLGYGIGLRLTVRALLGWSFISAFAVLIGTIGLGAGVLYGLTATVVAVVFLQAGYFLCVLIKPETSEAEETAPKSVETRGS
jgi:hypothetical protein